MVKLGKINGLRDALKVDDKLNSQGGGFFSLKDDGDTAEVRFLYEDDNDVDYAFVHKTEVNDKQRYVECLGEECVLCDTEGKPQLKLFLQLLQDGEVKLWERGKTFIPQYISLAERYSPLYDYEFEIERQGKKGSPQTKYQIFKLDDSDKLDPEVLEQKQQIKDGKNGFVLQLNASEMEDLVNGEFELKKEDKETKQEGGNKGKRRRRKPVDDDIEDEEVF